MRGLAHMMDGFLATRIRINKREYTPFVPKLSITYVRSALASSTDHYEPRSSTWLEYTVQDCVFASIWHELCQINFTPRPVVHSVSVCEKSDYFAGIVTQLCLLLSTEHRSLHPASPWMAKTQLKNPLRRLV